MKNIFLFIVIFNLFSFQKNVIVESKFTVYGNCEICKETIERNLLRIKGVKKAEWIIKTQQLHIVYNSNLVSEEVIQQKISSIGYSTDKISANEEAYNKLHFCCKVEGACKPR
jgi:mercuric ion binding protein